MLNINSIKGGCLLKINVIIHILHVIERITGFLFLPVIDD